MIDAKHIGRRVKVVNRTDAWNGRNGVLFEGPETSGKRWPVHLDETAPTQRHWFMPDELELEANG